MTGTRRCAVLLAALSLMACAADRATARGPRPPRTLGATRRAAAEATRFQLVHGPEDAADAARLAPWLEEGVKAVEAFFGAPFRDAFLVELFPDRASFSASFPPAWGMTDTQCWMVATGVADFLHVLAPRVWRAEACEHDPDDDRHVRGILVHELTHVFHGQYNPTRDFTGAEELGWFAEGLAVLVSDQLAEQHLARAAEAVRAGAVPAELESAWSGPYRYAVAGTLVQYVDGVAGREALLELLAATTEQELLAAIGRTEEELLAEWLAFVEHGAGE